VAFILRENDGEREGRNQMTSKKSLYLNTSSNSGIPDQIYSAILHLEPQIRGSWRVSMVADQTNDLWELKVTPEHGRPQRRKLNSEHQNVEGVQQALGNLTDPD
jgi:hypothetical protein